MLISFSSVWSRLPTGWAVASLSLEVGVVLSGASVSWTSVSSGEWPGRPSTWMPLVA